MKQHRSLLLKMFSIYNPKLHVASRQSKSQTHTHKKKIKKNGFHPKSKLSAIIDWNVFDCVHVLALIGFVRKRTIKASLSSIHDVCQ